MRILCQGDSITDANRIYDTNDLGEGYVKFIKQDLKEVEVINKGISGNRTLELLDRWQKDTLDVNPDILTILIGINEVWHHFRFQKYITKETYYETYRKLIQKAKINNPSIKILIIEPFVFKCGFYEAPWMPFLNDLQVLARRISNEYNLPFVPMQSILDGYLDTYQPEAILGDGVHPTELGHQLMAKHILTYLKEMMEE